MKKEPHDPCKKDENDAVTHFVISQLADTNDDCTTDDNAIEIVNVTRDFGTLDNNVETTPSHGLVDRILGGINRCFILDKHEHRRTKKK